jgi:hypothetical protein
LYDIIINIKMMRLNKYVLNTFNKKRPSLLTLPFFNKNVNAQILRRSSPIVSSRNFSSSPSSTFNADDTLKVLHRVQQILGHSFRFPRVVMCGDQSVGKTSVIESIIGADISVKDQAMATRRPLLLTLINIQHGALYAQFRDGEKMYDLKDVRERIEAENNVTEGDISTSPIELTIYATHVFDTILIDLPGFIMAPERHQDRNLPEQIQSMNLSYLNDKTNILAVVNSATADPATSMALREAYRADPDQERSLGVITKIDLCSKNATNSGGLLRMLRNETLALGLGRIGIRCRTHEEQKNNIDFETVIEREQEWIESSGFNKDPNIRLGVPLLRRVLSETLIERISKELPSIIRRLDVKIAKSKENEDFLTKLAGEKNMTAVAKELEYLVNQLHPSADARADFEKALRQEILDECESMTNQVFFDNFYDVKENVWDPIPYTHRTDFKDVGEIQGDGYDGAVDTSPILDSLNYDPKVARESFRDDLLRYSELFVYGGDSSNLDGIEQKGLDELRSRGIEVGATGAYFRQLMPDHPRRARSKWMRKLNSCIDDVIDGDLVANTMRGTSVQSSSQPEDTDDNAEHDIMAPAAPAAPSAPDRPDMNIENPGIISNSFEIFMNRLNTFAEEADSRHSKKGGNEKKLARMYFKFLLEKISNRIHDQQLQKELVGIVERERRPIASFLQLQNEVAKSMQYPSKISFMESIWGNNQKRVEVTMFNEDWTEAYRHVLSLRLGDDIFRLMAVRLLEPLVFEAIQFSLNLFNNNTTVAREAKMATKETKELVELRDALQDTAMRFKEKAEKEEMQKVKNESSESKRQTYFVKK